MKGKSVLALLLASSLALGNIMPVMAEEVSFDQENILQEVEEKVVDESGADATETLGVAEEPSLPELETEELEADIPEVLQPDIQQTQERTGGSALSDEPAARRTAVDNEFTVDYATYRVTSATTVAFTAYSYFGAADLVIPQSVESGGVTYQVTSVDAEACRRALNIETVTIPVGVTEIGERAFTMMSNLQSIDVQDPTANCVVVDNVMYSSDMTELWLYPACKTDESYTTPESVSVIKRTAITESKYLKSIFFSDSVTIYEDSAVLDLIATETITTGTGTISIGQGVFAYCKNLKELTLQGDLFDLRIDAIRDNPKLEKINLNGNIRWTLGYNFFNLPSLKEFVVTNSTYQKAVDGALYTGTTLMSYPAGKDGNDYVLPEDTTKIGPLAFSYPQNLTRIILNQGVRISAGAFNNSKNALDVYSRDDVRLNLDDAGGEVVFMDLPTGSHVYGKNKSVVDSILANPNTVESNISVEIGTIPATGVTLDKTSVLVNVGATDKVKATLAPYYSTETATWSSSDSKIATVDASGNITAIKAGTAIIKAKAGKVEGTCTVTVKAPLKGISLNKTEVSLKKGGTITLSVTYNPADTTDAKNVTWSSSDKSIAEVSTEGNVIAKARGTATITAKVGKFTATCKVNVGVPLEGISLNEDKVTINKGENTTLIVNYSPADTTDAKTVIWSSSNSKVATVKDGKVTAIAAGTATISAKVGSYAATCVMTVKSPLKGISLNKTDVSIKKDESTTLTVTYNPADTTDSKAISWSSSNSKVASVKDGKITGVASGTATITAKVGSFTASCKVTVGTPLKSITFDRSNLSIEEGKSDTLTVTYNPADTTDSKAITWSSSNSKVASVKDGKVTGVAPGTATITAKVGRFTASCKVTVSEYAISFPDVSKGAWYYDSAKWASQNGIISGYDNGKFGPADNLVRGQFATILYRMEGKPTTEFENVFSDVGAGHFYSIPAVWAKHTGVITGYENGKFGAVDLMTREQLATMLYRYAKKQGHDTSMRADLSGYPDAGRVSAFARDAMSWAVATGMIKGDQGNLNPNGNTVRAVAATVIMRFANAYR